MITPVYHLYVLFTVSNIFSC